MKSRACRGVQVLLTYIGAFYYKKTTRKGKMVWSGHGLKMFTEYLTRVRRNMPTDDIEITQIKQFYHLMEKISEDPENDPTGKSLLIVSGAYYHMFTEQLDRLEMNILRFLMAMLEGAASGSTEKGTK
jgi:hypothetical protein